MKQPWLGQIPVATERRAPFMGQGAPKYYCIKTEPNRSQVKLEFEKRGLTCVNTWGSPPGIYPGVPDCGPDGKPVGCEPPPSPRMSGTLRERHHHHEMGRGQNCCRVPGTQERPCFTYNPTTQRCGNDWMDTSNADWPECVPAPPGYGGAYVSPAAPAAGGGTGGGGQQCPPGEFWDGTKCRGSVGTMPGMGSRLKGGRTRLGQAGQGWIPPSCAPASTPPSGGGGGGTGGGSTGGGGSSGGGSTYPVVNGCPDIPSKYKPLPGGGVAVGGAVLACKRTDGNYDVYSYTDPGPALFTNVTPTCLQQFGDVTMAQEGDTRCGGAQNTPMTGPCRLPTDKKYISCPPSNGITVDYYLEAETGHYAPNMTTQSSECRNNPNVIQVGAESPYCGGGEVSGSGEQYPSLVACWKQAGNSGDNWVDVHNGSDMALLASNIKVSDIPTRFPGRKWMVVMDNHCSALPNFGQVSSAAPAPTPTPTPMPTPTPPTGIPVSNTGVPPTTGTQPSYESGPPVLPPQQHFTQPAMPTGAWPGAPFPSMPPVQGPLKATAPAPRPEVCPLGPVKIAKWAEECALSKKRS